MLTKPDVLVELSRGSMTDAAWAEARREMAKALRLRSQAKGQEK